MKFRLIPIPKYINYLLDVVPIVVVIFGVVELDVVVLVVNAVMVEGVMLVVSVK